MPNLAPESIAIGRFRLVFDWRGDRFGHRVQLADSAAGGSPWRTLLESIEGTPDETWPASPVLQEFHCEARDDDQMVALLVGRAGKSHWSLSVLCDRRREELLFEAACRFGKPPLWLGSRYSADALGAPIDPSSAEPGVLISRVDGGVIRGYVQNGPLANGPNANGPASNGALAAEAIWRLRPTAGGADCSRQVCTPDECSQELSLAASSAGSGDEHGDGFRTICWSYRIGIR